MQFSSVSINKMKRKYFLKMKNFCLKKYSPIPRDDLFQISTDIENFGSIMPNYFKSLSIVEESSKEKFVDEQITFLGKTVNVRTKHVVIHPNIHQVYILTGPLKGTSFIENYSESGSGTEVTITISLHLNGFLRFIPFIENIIGKRMEFVMTEFLSCAEKFLKNSV